WGPWLRRAAAAESARSTNSGSTLAGLAIWPREGIPHRVSTNSRRPRVVFAGSFRSCGGQPNRRRHLKTVSATPGRRGKNAAMRMRRFWFAAAVVAASACKSNEQPAANQPARGGKQAAPTTTPADISRGDARVGTAVDSAPIDPAPPPRATEHRVHVHFVIHDTLIEVSKGVHYRAWTFEGRVPGPTIRLTQGDSV